MDSSEVIAGRFELLGVLGRGAMGEVRKARDLVTVGRVKAASQEPAQRVIEITARQQVVGEARQRDFSEARKDEATVMGELVRVLGADELDQFLQTLVIPVRERLGRGGIIRWLILG